MNGDLQRRIETLWNQYQDGTVDEQNAEREQYELLDTFLDQLEEGSIRAATKEDGGWSANEWVKHGILLNFSLRPIEPRSYGDVQYHDVLPLRRTDDLAARGSRNTPDGTTIRRGCHIGADCILMSPSFVNIGARIGDDTLVDSCNTVGSCAQIGEGVKLGANTVIGGVLEPVENAPVVIEDGVSLGAGCRVTSGFVVGEDSIVGEDTLLSPRIPVYDLVEDAVLYGELPSERRAFTRFVESSVGQHDLFDSGAYKPAVVALELGEDTLKAAEREDILRDQS
jgi:2,3,4,5-tetrahydropyridine-2-carboxylate N-succinyltransferase